MTTLCVTNVLEAAARSLRQLYQNLRWSIENVEAINSAAQTVTKIVFSCNQDSISQEPQIGIQPQPTDTRFRYMFIGGIITFASIILIEAILAAKFLATAKADHHRRLQMFVEHAQIEDLDRDSPSRIRQELDTKDEELYAEAFSSQPMSTDSAIMEPKPAGLILQEECKFRVFILRHPGLSVRGKFQPHARAPHYPSLSTLRSPLLIGIAFYLLFLARQFNWEGELMSSSPMRSMEQLLRSDLKRGRLHLKDTEPKVQNFIGGEALKVKPIVVENIRGDGWEHVRTKVLEVKDSIGEKAGKKD